MTTVQLHVPDYVVSRMVFTLLTFDYQ